MSSPTDWILEALERDPSKTRAGMARALNLDKSAITRLLSGQRQLKFHEAEKIAAYLGRQPPGVAAAGGLREEEAQFLGPGAPIFEAETLGNGVWMLRRDRAPIDRRPPAPQFENAAKLFGLYAPDAVMAPRFRAGEIVWADPARPPEVGGDAILFERGENPTGERIVVCFLKAASADEWTVQQHAVSGEKRFSCEAWRGAFVPPRA